MEQREQRADVVDVGIDLGGGKTALAVIGAGGEVVHQITRPTRSREGPEEVMSDLLSLVRESVAEVGRELGRVGVGVCGQVARGTGVVRDAPNLAGWRDIPLRHRLEEALGAPVAVANDLKTIALGEWRQGAGRGADDVVVVFVGTGIGGAVISDRRLLLGHGGHAGEIGHTTVEVGGRECSCGNHGCVEAYAAGWAIAKRAREAVAERPAETAGSSLVVELAGSIDEITSRTVAEARARGDELALRIADETGRYLAAAMANVVNVFNPRRLVLGGGVVEGFPDLVGAVRDQVSRSALSACAEDVEIVPAELGGYAGAVGAVILARELYPERPWS